TSPTEAVKVWIATMIGSAARPDLAARARLFASLGQINSGFPALVVDARQPMLAPLVEALQHGLDSGELALARPEADARLIMPLCGGVLRDLLDGTTKSTVADAIADTQSLVLRGLGAQP